MVQIFHSEGPWIIKYRYFQWSVPSIYSSNARLNIFHLVDYSGWPPKAISVENNPNHLKAQLFFDERGTSRLFSGEAPTVRDCPLTEWSAHLKGFSMANCPKSTNRWTKYYSKVTNGLSNQKWAYKSDRNIFSKCISVQQLLMTLINRKEREQITKLSFW